MILVTVALMKADTFAGEAGQEQSKAKHSYTGLLPLEVTYSAFHHTSPATWPLTHIC